MPEKGASVAADMPFTETDDFKAAVDLAVEEQIKRLIPTLMAEIGDAKRNAGTLADDDDGVPMFAKQLAHEIASNRAHENGRINVEPAEMKRRAEAFNELQKTLVELHGKAAQFYQQNPTAPENPYVPRYKLISKTQLLFPINGQLVPVLVDPLYQDDMKRQRQTEIDHPSIPNIAMLPDNEPAERVMSHFRRYIGEESVYDHDLGPMALTQNGTVIRGAAAAALLRNTRQDVNQSPVTLSAAGYQTTRIHRGDSQEAYGRNVQVLGTMTAPLRVR